MKKRIICLFLCVVMVLSMATLFSSCGKGDGEPKVSKKTVSVDLTDYTAVLAADLTANAKTQATAFLNSLKDVTGLKLKSQNDREVDYIETEDKELLIGNTYRVETQKVMKSLGECGWGIRVFDNKIVIAGTDSLMTRAALSYFEQNYLNKAEASATLSINQKVSLAKVGTIELLSKTEDENGDGAFDVVYSDLVDDFDQPEAYFLDNTIQQGGEGYDLTYDLCKTFVKDLATATELRSSAFSLKTDAAEESEYEFLFGKVNREDYMTELRKLAANQYGIVIKNGKVMVLAWNDSMLELCVSLLEDLVDSSAVEDKKGNVKYVLPAALCVIETSTTPYALDFPKPEGEGITLDGTVEVGDNSMEYIYTGSGVNRDSFVAYCEKLEAAGYALVGKENQHEGSSYRQYLNNTTGSTLYVYHSAYTFAAAQGVTNVLPSLRIIAGHTDYVNLPSTKILNPNQSYNKVTETKITSLYFDYDNGQFGMTYIYTLEDGSFIVFDGGSGLGAWDGCQYVYGKLTELWQMSKKDPNATPSASDPIVIRAWILTHEHGDHYGAFNKFIRAYCSAANRTARIEHFFFNAASYTEGYNTTNPDTLIKNLIPDMDKQYGCTYVKVHTGQTFYFANAKIEILYTHEDLYPKKIEYWNNTSTTCKITVSGDKGETTGIWLGDLERIGSQRMRAMWSPEMLKADMVQVAHHGYNGSESELYDIIQPTIVWYPTSAKNIKGMTDTGSSSYWYYNVDYRLCRETESVKIVIAADLYESTMLFEGGAIDPELRVWDLGGMNEAGEEIFGLTDEVLVTPGDSMDSGAAVIRVR